MAIIFRKVALKGRSPAGDVPYPLPPAAGAAAVVEGVVGPSNVPLHKHDDEEHYWFILEGSGRAVVGEEEFEVEPGDLIITPPGILHRIWTKPEGSENSVATIRVLEWAMKRGDAPR